MIKRYFHRMEVENQGYPYSPARPLAYTELRHHLWSVVFRNSKAVVRILDSDFDICYFCGNPREAIQFMEAYYVKHFTFKIRYYRTGV